MMYRTLLRYRFNRYRHLRTHYYRRISTSLNSYAVNLYLSSRGIYCHTFRVHLNRHLLVEFRAFSSFLWHCHSAHGTVCRWGEWWLGKVVIRIFQCSYVLVTKTEKDFERTAQSRAVVELFFERNDLSSSSKHVRIRHPPQYNDIPTGSGWLFYFEPSGWGT